MTNLLRKSLNILSERGLWVLLGMMRTFLATKWFTRVADEANIAFEALNASSRKGVMIDVGAHFGGSLLQFAEHDWDVFAFEPDAENREKLQAKFGDNPNVHIDSRAVSDKSGQNVPFFGSHESTGISGLSAFHKSHEEKSTVSMTTLGIFMEEQCWVSPTIDFLKIDTEGYDLNVLRSFPWGKTQPRIILCEFEDFKTQPLGYDYHDLAQFLVGKGYSLIISEWYPIERYGSSHRWRQFSRYPCELQHDDAWGNILAAKDEEVYASLVTLCKLAKLN
ncbi:MAG: hypothetical protein DRR42_20480 [Gammaproteobacteria bacterium]|nr:MAG: hypothetical protein DRR42_20480 [Gammaproteobacteria bacterium]